MAVENKGVARANSFEGQKSGLPIESYSLESGSEIKNFVLKEGALQRVAGGETYAEVLPTESGGVASLHRFKNLWIAQRGTAIACEDSEGSATFTTILSGLSSSAKMFSASWRDRMFFVNGQDAKFYYQSGDITKVGDIGLDPADGDTAIAAGWDSTSISSAAAGNVANGTYYYIFTLLDETTNSESPAVGNIIGPDGLYELSPNSPFSGIVVINHTVSGGPKTVRIANMAAVLTAVTASIPRATHFSVYRGTTVSATLGDLYNTFYRVPLKNGGTQDGASIIRISDFVSAGADFVDNTATLAAVTLPENNGPPPTPARMLKALNEFKEASLSGIEENWSLSDYSGFTSVRFFRDQLFGIGAYNPGFTITGLGITGRGLEGNQTITGQLCNFDSILHGSEVYQPDYWPYIWEVGRGDGQDAIGLGVLGDTALLAFKEKSTYYLSGSSPDNYILRIMDTNVGCIHQSTIQETPKGVICLDRAGFFLFDKIGLGRKISRQIQDIIDDIDFTKAANFYSWYDPKDQRYYCAVAQSPYTYPNLTLCFDLDSEEWTYLQGAEGASRMADTSSQGEFVDLQGSSTNGRLIDLSDPSVVTFNGQVVESIWTSGPVTFGNEQYQKRLRWLYLRVKCAGSWTVRIEIIPDYNEMKKYTIDSYNIGTSNATWYSDVAANDGTLIWDEGAWAYAELRRDVVKIPVLGKGRSFQVRIINRDTNALAHSFTIENISLEAKGLDK